MAERADGLDVDEGDPHWGMICHSPKGPGVGFMSVWVDSATGNSTISCEHCGAWVEVDTGGSVTARSGTLEEQMTWASDDD